MIFLLHTPAYLHYPLLLSEHHQIQCHVSHLLCNPKMIFFNGNTMLSYSPTVSQKVAYCSVQVLVIIILDMNIDDARS